MIRQAEEYEIIKKSKLWSSDFYLKKYSDVAAAGIDPIYHFIQYGAAELRDPSADFSVAHYLSQYPEIRHFHINPLVHYELTKENQLFENLNEKKDLTNLEKLNLENYRIISQSKYFCEDYYVATNSKIDFDEVDPIVHFIKFGADQKRNPSHYFSVTKYIEREPSINMNPLVHYELYGRSNGKMPPADSTAIIEDHSIWEDYNTIEESTNFSDIYYAEKNPDLLKSRSELVLHYLNHGAFEYRDPSEKFSSEAYLKTNPDVELTRINPLVHYERFGRDEGRQIFTKLQYAIYKRKRDLSQLCQKNWHKMSKIAEDYSELFSRLYYQLMRQLIINGHPSFDSMVGILDTLVELVPAIQKGLTIVFTNDADPIRDNKKDGYIQRILAIDEILSNAPRLYIKFGNYKDSNTTNLNDQLKLEFHDNGLALIEFYAETGILSAFLNVICKNAKIIYSHSIGPYRRIIAREAILSANCIKILDFHGVVPEEFRLYDWNVLAFQFEDFERQAVLGANVILCVTDQMKEHLVKKYGVDRQRLITFPIFIGQALKSKRLKNDVIIIKGETQKFPRLVYAGGNHKWQKIEQMVDFLVSIHTKIDFTILTPDPETVRDLLVRAGMSKEKAEESVFSAEAEQLATIYNKSEYGIALRDDSIVNRVACPTKIIEYLMFDIVPILTFTSIGDFENLGMKYVTVTQIIESGFPTTAQRQVMIKHNRKVLDQIRKKGVAGEVALKEVCNA